MIHKQRWTLAKIKQRLQLIAPLVYRQRHTLPPFRYQGVTQWDHTPPVAPNCPDDDWQVIPPGSYWGRWRTGFVLRTTFQIPSDWANVEAIALYLPLGDAGDFCHPEALVYLDGQPIAACDRYHQEIRLPNHVRDGQTHLLALHGWTGLGGSIEVPRETQLWMSVCELVVLELSTRNFIAVARIAHQTATVLAETDVARGRILNALNDAFNTLDTREPWGERFYESIAAAMQTLHTGLEQASPPLDVDIIAAGHAHIDVAWLWTLDQTRQKTRRTFHTVLHLMEHFPAYQFTQSQPQLYAWLQEDDPALFACIRERIAEGRWEAIGGMWVEADCNLTGAEALARQFLLGRTFFREHFGPEAESPILWLPDVFGYTWNLPQLIKQAGLDYFFTIKIGWSQYNRMPYDAFWWQGLDGTRILTHYSPTPEGGSAYASTYNAQAVPQDTLGTWHNFQQKEQAKTLLMAFGHGDGGGGPTQEMIENIATMGHFPGLPKIRPGKAIDFFRQLEAEAGTILPVWKGELYLEYHRGTYTTQGRNKRANRKAEFLLHDADFLLAVAFIQTQQVDGDPTPLLILQNQLRHAWELVCLNQFHDIIPGSSIGEVYEQSQKQYREIMTLGEHVKDVALQTIAAATSHTAFIINPTSFTQHQLLQKSSFTLKQGFTDTVDPGPLPPYSLTPLAEGFVGNSSHLLATRNLLENNFVRVTINEAGDITHLYDKINKREIISPGSVANEFQAFEDRPMYWDAWDIDIFYDDRRWLAEPATSIEVIQSGPHQATIEIQRRILRSHYTQRITLTHHSPRLDIHTRIDWRERHILLKVAFPVHIFAPTATYETQWGNVERSTHRNTSWDWARFEVCAHKWVDVSEGDYGVSLLNDCKYGHDIQDNTPDGTTIRLSLLRSPTMPDPEADQGVHEFSYALLPHSGRWGTDTVREAYALNDPIFIGVMNNISRPTNVQPLKTGGSFIALNKEHVVIETVKVAEDGQGIIVRLYECQRRRGLVTMKTSFPLAAAYRTNLLEDNEESLPHSLDSVQLAIRPYEIITLRLVYDSS